MPCHARTSRSVHVFEPCVTKVGCLSAMAMQTAATREFAYAQHSWAVVDAYTALHSLKHCALIITCLPTPGAETLVQAICHTATGVALNGFVTTRTASSGPRKAIALQTHFKS